MKTKSFKLIIAALTLFTAGTTTRVHAGKDSYAGKADASGRRIIAIRADLVNNLSARGGLQMGGFVRFGGVPQYFLSNAGTTYHADGSHYLKFQFSNNPVVHRASQPNASRQGSGNAAYSGLKQATYSAQTQSTGSTAAWQSTMPKTAATLAGMRPKGSRSYVPGASMPGYTLVRIFAPHSRQDMPADFYALPNSLVGTLGRSVRAPYRYTTEGLR